MYGIQNPDTESPWSLFVIYHLSQCTQFIIGTELFNQTGHLIHVMTILCEIHWLKSTDKLTKMAFPQ